MTVKERIENQIKEYERLFNKYDCFKTWVDTINYGEKYIVHCSVRVEFLGRRKTFKYQTTITA